MKSLISKWGNLTNEITENWIKEYFELEEDESVDFYWVADDIGTIFEFADYFFNFSNVLDCYKYNISKESLFLWYDYCLEEQFVNISLAKFILSPEEKAKKEKESLEKTKENLFFAEKLFNKELEKYKKL
jgi:hypothetical protein